MTSKEISVQKIENCYTKNYNKVQCNTTKIEELSDQLKSIPVPGNLASYLPLNAAPVISQFVM